MLFSQPEPLTASHDTLSFDCGKAPLNQFLQRYALVNQATGSARTFVSLSRGQISGYYSLAAASAEHAAVPLRISKGLARHPIPMLLLARLAVDLKAQGQGLGPIMLDAAEVRAGQLGRSVIRLYTGSKLNTLIGWYHRHGYEIERTEKMADRELTHMAKTLQFASN